MTEETVDEFDAAFDEITNPVEEAAEEATETVAEATEATEETVEETTEEAEVVDQSTEDATEEIAAEDASDEPVASEPNLDAIQHERDQLLQYKRSNEGRVSALQQKINQLQRQPDRPQPAPPPANITPEKWSEFEEEYPEIAQAINARMGAMESTISQQVDGQIGQAVQPLQNAERDRYLQSQYAALEAAHPGWKDVVKSESFMGWLSAQPQAVQGFMDSEDASDASYLLDTYKHGQPQQPQAEPDPKVAEIRAQREKKLSQSQGIKSRPTPGATGGMPDDFDSAFDHFVRQKERVSR